MIFKAKYYLTSLLAISFLFSSCSHEKKKPGYEYFDDMVVSLAYETDSENPVFKDGKTDQLPVEGTIARGQEVYDYAPKQADEMTRAGKELINPIKMDSVSLETGKKQFTIYCMVCHGEQGKGDGTIVANGKFPARPADLGGDRVTKLKDGEIFYVITSGSISGLMGAHGSQVKVDDRWMIINYIRNGFSTKLK